MAKLVRFLAMPALVLVLSLTIMSTGAFAQSVALHAIHGVLPAGATLAKDGPSPIDTGNGGAFGGNGGNNGFNNGGFGGHGGFGNGGFGGWNGHVCANHHCGGAFRSVKRCFRRASLDKSFTIIRRQSLLVCRWIKAERW